MNKKSAKRYQDMNTTELAEATKEFDRPFAFEKARPMNAAERKAWQKAKRGRGRPKIGGGSKKINITIERSLLKEADKLAKREGLNRSQILALGLESILSRKAG